MTAAFNRHRTRTLWLIGILHAFTHLYTVALLPLYLRIHHGLGLSSVAQATLLVTVMGLAYVLPSYPIGVLADRFSRKKLMGFGLVVNGLGFVLLAMAPNYPIALAGVIIAGLGGSFYHPAATALVARLFPEGRGKALGLVGIGASAGFFLGPLYCGWRSASAANWRAPVLEIGLLGVLGAILFLWLADEEKPLPEPQGPNGPKTPVHRIPLFGSAALWFYFLAGALILSFRDFAGQAMGTSASLFLQNAHGYGPKFAGMALSTVFLMSAISNPLFGHLSDQGRLRWGTVVLACAGILAAVVPWLSLPMVIPVFLAYGFFFMASFPIIEAALMEAVPDTVRARVFGLFMTIGGLVANLSHWMVGKWVESLRDSSRTPSSYHSLFAVLGAMILVSVLAFPFLHALRQAEHLDPKVESSPRPTS